MIPSELKINEPKDSDLRSGFPTDFRSTKKCLRDCFPNISGEVTATSESINAGVYCGGWPVGSITMFSGSVLPPKWAFCDGTNGTPDLRDRFIRGLPSKAPASLYGGYDSVDLTKYFTPRYLALKPDHLPSHSHRLGNNYQTLGGTFDGDAMNTRGSRSANFIDAGGTSVIIGWYDVYSLWIPIYGLTTEYHNHGTRMKKPLDLNPPYYQLAFIMYTGRHLSNKEEHTFE